MTSVRVQSVFCSAAQYVVYCRLTTIDDSLWLNPNRCHYHLSWDGQYLYKLQENYLYHLWRPTRTIRIPSVNYLYPQFALMFVELGEPEKTRLWLCNPGTGVTSYYGAVGTCSKLSRVFWFFFNIWLNFFLNGLFFYDFFLLWFHTCQIFTQN